MLQKDDRIAVNTLEVLKKDITANLINIHAVNYQKPLTKKIMQKELRIAVNALRMLKGKFTAKSRKPHKVSPLSEHKFLSKQILN